MMKVKIYLSNLRKYTGGNENGKWVQLPMESEKLHKVFNDIVGKDEEWIILDSDAPFFISEYDDIFELNNLLKNFNESGIDDVTVKLICRVSDTKEEALERLETGSYIVIDVDAVSSTWMSGIDYEELYGLVLHEEGYNNLFKEPIPEDMIDYIDFSQVWTDLSVNDGWQAVTINNETYLVTTRI
ncbi:antirestriction protein ArdA [Blautia massiliensis (ex Durand et al. 2017)]|uniref:antirestriction protein ArdA n=1 Tax=Blautia massiliensis (ex Durand et al. 2017) TaxID=1737424 RepID=UPI00189D49FC|nr:antirestriction protein ArdA [Blautia massiliensis (ex Durand et al. 2017)]